jgi:catechol 2,3-dioxygenase-like lactoylglutathione lyase family enzyme
MLSGVCIGTNDITSAAEFYDKVLGTIGMTCVFSEKHERGYAGSDGKITVYVVVPYNEQKATFGNGTQIMFHAPDKDSIHKFHAMALICGGSDEGAPGPRDYHPDYYGAYVRDRDGNKLHVALRIES